MEKQPFPVTGHGLAPLVVVAAAPPEARGAKTRNGSPRRSQRIEGYGRIARPGLSYAFLSEAMATDRLVMLAIGMMVVKMMAVVMHGAHGDNGGD